MTRKNELVITRNISLSIVIARSSKDDTRRLREVGFKEATVKSIILKKWENLCNVQ